MNAGVPYNLHPQRVHSETFLLNRHASNVLAHYNDAVADLVKGEFREWRETMEQCLVAIYGPEVGHREAEAMMILIAGTFICNYNGALTGEISDNIIGYLGNLTQS